MSTFGRWAAGVGIFGGLMMIVAIADDGPEKAQPAVEIREVQVEKTIEVKVPTVPQECLDLSIHSRELREAVARYEEAIGSHQSIIQLSHTAIAQRDVERLIAADERHRKLKSDTLEILLDIRDLTALVAATEVACLKKTR